MINERARAAVEGAAWHGPFIRPLYESYCFSHIPATIGSLLGVEGGAGLPADVLGDLPRRYEKVILLFVDAFGWRFFAEHADGDPFLRRIVAEGAVSKLTSQFPSTTAAHTTTIHTGLPVGQHGVYEWFYYEPALDLMISPLIFSEAGDRERGTLLRRGVTPGSIFPPASIYQGLARQGVRSFVFQSQDYTPSPAGEVIFQGAAVIPFRTLPEALTRLAALLDEPGRGYYFLYYDSIDTIGHHYGPDSPFIANEIAGFLAVMERVFHGKLAARRRDTLLLLTADHGQVATDPRTTIYLNRELPGLGELLRRNRAGRLLVPGGSARDMFLYVEPDRLAEAEARLHAHLAGRAEVHRVADLIAAGFFGPEPPSPAFLGHAGNLVILPYEGEAVWWYESGRFGQPFHGHHGGLTRPEMETLLLAEAFG